MKNGRRSGVDAACEIFIGRINWIWPDGSGKNGESKILSPDKRADVKGYYYLLSVFLCVFVCSSVFADILRGTSRAGSAERRWRVQKRAGGTPVPLGLARRTAAITLAPMLA